jgi:hypothetical protein
MREMFSRTGRRGRINKKKKYKLRGTRSANHAIGKQHEIMGFISRDMLRSPKLHLIWYNLGDLVLMCAFLIKKNPPLLLGGGGGGKEYRVRSTYPILHCTFMTLLNALHDQLTYSDENCDSAADNDTLSVAKP